MMVMSGRKKRIYAGVMILGGIAMVVDRSLPSATVTSPDIALASRPPTASVMPKAAPLSIPELPFPRGLEPFDPKSELRDLFEPPHLRSDGDSIPAASDNPTADAGNRIGLGESTSAAFVTQHTLEGILVDERLKIAVIDGEFVQVGQSVGGCMLTSITATDVRFKCRDGTAALKVDTGELLGEH